MRYRSIILEKDFFGVKKKSPGITQGLFITTNQSLVSPFIIISPDISYCSFSFVLETTNHLFSFLTSQGFIQPCRSDSILVIIFYVLNVKIKLSWTIVVVAPIWIGVKRVIKPVIAITIRRMTPYANAHMGADASMTASRMLSGSAEADTANKNYCYYFFHF